MTGNRGKKQEVQHPIDKEFDVEFHPVYLGTSLEDLILSYTIPRTKHPSHPENAEEILDKRVGDALNEGADGPHNQRERDNKEEWVVDEGIRTDGGTVLGLLDISRPQPWGNSQRLYTANDLHIT